MKKRDVCWNWPWSSAPARGKNASAPRPPQAKVVHPPEHDVVRFNNRRSNVLSKHGAVACSQPLAAQIGLSILESGGNAADACIAMAAALNVTEPVSTGIGGDCFCIFYRAETQNVSGINGSGRSPAALTRDLVLARQQAIEASTTKKFKEIPLEFTVTVPGAAAGWCETHAQFGSSLMTMSELLAPAIDLAENGYPVHELAARQWNEERSVRILNNVNNPGGQEMMIDGVPPQAGQIFRNQGLAKTFKLLGEHGKEAFYTGAIAEAIVAAVERVGGVLSMEDLAKHHSESVTPIKVNYEGVDVWEIPPNGQGITALLALNIITAWKRQNPHKAWKSGADTVPADERQDHPGAINRYSADYMHVLIEAMRLAFADTRAHVCDLDISDPDRKQKAEAVVEKMLTMEYAEERAALLDLNKATTDQKAGPLYGSDTVSFCAVDRDGNACSFINSNYMGLGTGLVAEGFGFTLQNRGANFSMEKDHPNVLEPNKRPYHTIIPGLATKDGELYCPFSVMGGFNQPQGHVQVLLNMIDFNMSPQRSLDMPRFCIGNGTAGGVVSIEDSMGDDVIQELIRRGHRTDVVSGYDRMICGRGQIIQRRVDKDEVVYWAGSDGRADGCAAGLAVAQE